MPERFLRLKEVQARVPFSRSSIYMKVSRSEFPKPFHIGARAIAWLEDDIDKWIAERLKERP